MLNRITLKSLCSATKELWSDNGQKMRVEEWAKKILSRELNCSVELHDNGSIPSMYDLRVGLVSSPEIAIECVGAVNQVFTETWNVGPAQGPLSIGTQGDWIVTVQPNARIKPLQNRLEEVLRDCERNNIKGYYPVDRNLKNFAPRLHSLLTQLMVTSIHMYRSRGEGKAFLSMDGDGGSINFTGNGIAEWVTEFLYHEYRKDVRKKLSSSGAKENHVFVPIAFRGATWEVESYFCTEMSGNIAAPKLPRTIDAVWLTSNGKGLKWHHNEWRGFDALLPIAGNEF
jgi:hypothetical protein